MRLDEAALDEYTDDFQRDALRYETLTAYTVASDGDDFARYLAGEPAPSPDVLGPWGSWVRTQRRRGTTVRRVRVLTEKPSDYLRFELEWIYPANEQAGENIRVLDLTDQARPAGVVDVEFWLLDGDRAALMTYADDGTFLHADTVEGDDASPVRRAAAAAWGAAETLSSWWARHPEHRRG